MADFHSIVTAAGPGERYHRGMDHDEGIASIKKLLATYDRKIAEREADLAASAAEIVRLEAEADAAYGVATGTHCSQTKSGAVDGP